jgi:hypothetical protein
MMLSRLRRTGIVVVPVVVALAAMAVVAPSAVADPSACDAVVGNVVQNCGFETGNTSGWSIASAFTGVDSVAHSGNYGLYAGTVGFDGTVSQTVSTVASATYTFSYWLSNSGGTPNDFHVTLDGVSGGPVSFDSMTDAAGFGWTQFTHTVTAAGASVTITFAARQDPSFYHVDDVVLVPVQQAQTITFAQPASPQPYGTSTTLSATATSGLPVTFTVDATSDPGVCQTSGIFGVTLTFTGVGTCLVDANQSGDSVWLPAPQVQHSIIVSKAATTTTLVASPSNPALNQPVTLTATVAHSGGGAVPSGTVSFYDASNLLGTAPLTGGTTATLTTTLGGGSHALTATYSGDGYYLGSSSTPAIVVSVACDHTYTGTVSGLVATSGVTCIYDATVSGGISVARGASLDLENSTVAGSISANAPAGIRICGSHTGSIAISGATGFVRIGDPANNCAVNTIKGGLTAAGNHGGGTISGNTITGSWLITNNTPPFTATGNHH